MNSDALASLSRSNQPSPSAAVALAILATVLLCANAIGIVEKSGGLLANPVHGVISDTTRFLVFFATGALAARIGKTGLTTALWVLGLSFIDRAFIALRVAWIADSSPSLMPLLLGVAGIYLVTAPLVLLVAFTGYQSAKSFSWSREKSEDARAQASLFLVSAGSAFIVYFVFALTSYLLLWIADFPIFYLSYSQQAVSGLFYAAVGISIIALALWVIRCLAKKQILAWPRVVLGTCFLLVAIAIAMR